MIASKMNIITILDTVIAGGQVTINLHLWLLAFSLLKLYAKGIVFDSAVTLKVGKFGQLLDLPLLVQSPGTYMYIY